MDYLIEAKKFIQRAQDAHNPEVTKTDLEMAEWFLAKAIEEREHTPAESLANQTEKGSGNLAARYARVRS